MALQIVTPNMVRKAEPVARLTAQSKPAAIERVVERLTGERKGDIAPAARMHALLAQIDRIPDRHDAFIRLEWDEQGLPGRS